MPGPTIDASLLLQLPGLYALVRFADGTDVHLAEFRYLRHARRAVFTYQGPGAAGNPLSTGVAQHRSPLTP